MKNVIKLTLLAILVMVIAFTMTACPNPEENSGNPDGTETPGGGSTEHIHQWSSWVQTKAPTETQDGSQTRTCTNNPTHSETRPIPALGHTCNWGSWTVTTAPTFITEGEETRTCSLNVAHKETRTSPALQITSTADWNTAISQLNGKTGNYTLTIDGNIGVDGIEYPDYKNTFGITNGSSVTLKGAGKLYLTSNGNLFRIHNTIQTLVIDSASLLLEGTPTNSESLIYVNRGTLELKNGTISGNKKSGVDIYLGTFTMSGGTISGNTGSGVDVNGTFTMSGGTITNNTDVGGGGVYVYSGTFTMNGGTITNNTASVVGGGVYVVSYGTFNMYGGTITNNTAERGGGVSVTGSVFEDKYGTFNMYGGTISGNTATYQGGGGVCATSGIFNMYDGIISGNTSTINDGYSKGGGVSVGDYGGKGTFHMVNGTIYGLNESNAALRNTAVEGEAVLYINGTGTAEYGIFSGSTWNRNGSLSNSDNTIRVVNGVLQP
jgi:hypothetical protein